MHRICIIKSSTLYKQGLRPIELIALSLFIQSNPYPMMAGNFWKPAQAKKQAKMTRNVAQLAIRPR